MLPNPEEKKTKQIKGFVTFAASNMTSVLVPVILGGRGKCRENGFPFQMVHVFSLKVNTCVLMHFRMISNERF